ncbi:host attachment protein [Rhizobium alvei]|uniref:Host attachment protein n=1 Tax=Rhizobium alvei TaxID=1132659 RepID=A0ABT8YI86_9HYPH|nr:host attachment protein [Rhizobium alvei]MDO6962980.1 host attachment protein [Rhizobium alvei]
MEGMLLPRNAWLLVCDGATARIFANEGNADKPRLGLHFAFDEKHDSAHELGTDRPGRLVAPGGGPISATEETDWHAKAEETFLKKVAAALEDAIKGEEARAVLVIAPPKALGFLRDCYGDRTRKALAGEWDKDLTALSPEALAARFAG